MYIIINLSKPIEYRIPTLEPNINYGLGAMIRWCNFISCNKCTNLGASQVALVVKYLPANAEDVRDAGLIPGLRRPPGREYGNPLQYSCLENPMDREVWQATVHGVTKNWTPLKRLSMHTHNHHSK